MMADEPQRWLTLTTRFGQEFDNPSRDDCRRAQEELSQKTHEGMAAADSAEQSTACLRLESDAGPHFILIIDDGAVTYCKFENPEADDPVLELTQKVTPDRTLELMMMFADGKCEQVEEAMSPVS